MKSRALAVLLAWLVLFAPALPTLAASPLLFSGDSGATPGGGGGGSDVIAHIKCMYRGVEYADGDLIAMKYGDALMCWGAESMVNGNPVNPSGAGGQTWTPIAFFDWDFGGDNGMGTVSRGGLTQDLGKAVGLVVATGFKPSTFAETCGGGGDNSLETIRLDLYTLAGSDDATIEVCTENPTTTWPTPVAFCDDANCANDAGVPAGTVHGGDNTTPLHTILDYCDANGTELVLVEGGVTFTSGNVSIDVGGTRCRIASYGGSKAKFHFTNTSTSSTAIRVNSATCAGYALDGITFAGSGSAPRLINAGGVLGAGCYAIWDSNVSTTGGEELAALTINGSDWSQRGREMYYLKFDYTKHNSGNAANFFYAEYVGFIGGTISGMQQHIDAEHNLRFAQWIGVVIDAMRLEGQQLQSQDEGILIALRQNCGSGDPCGNQADAHLATIARTELNADPGGTLPVQICAPGSGSPEATKCRDIDIVRVLGRHTGPSAGVDHFMEFANSATGHEVSRVRVIQSAFDLTAIATSSAGNRVALMPSYTTQGVRDTAWVGNVIAYQGTSIRAYGFTANSTATMKNNVCWETGASSTCDPFPNASPDGSNVEVESATSPFTVTPGTHSNFDFPDLVPRTTSSPPLHNAGDDDGIPTDVDGDSRCQGTDCEPGVHEVI